MVTENQPQSDGNTAFLRAARAGHLDKVLEQLKNNVDINTSNANGLNALHLASKDGHINVVSELLKRGAKVDSATKKGNTALHIASLAGQEEVVKHLVEHGACVNVQSQNGFTPLYMAAQENHDAVVRFLLANGANQSLATEDGFTPLAVAMQQGHDKVVTVLLENDTRGKVRLPALHIAAKKDDTKAAALLLQNEHNPDVTSKSGFTPLHIASHYGNEAIANLLLSKGADVNYAAKHNITPLHVAAKWGKANMVSVLLSRGANIEAKTRDGLTPLHCAARSGHEQVVDMLLERGAPISAKTKNGLAALHMSSQGDHVDAARILLYHRAPVDDVTVDYLTALHVAAHCGHVGVARLLLDRKADPNARALNGFTPLHIACKKNRIKVVELLLKHGASIEATTESGLTPLHVASFMGCMNIVIYLVQNEAGPDVKTVRGETPLHLAARANQTDIIRILLRNGAQVDARAREQQTPLHIASRLGNVDIVMLLLQHGASVDSTTKDLYTALHIAAKEGQDEVASVLLENGASLEATTKKGFTPLHLAAKYGHMNVAKLLLRRDAPVDAQGKNGVTPLHVASHYDHQNVALLLLEKGASPHATAKNGHTPLHIAARKNQMDIATTLLEYGAKANAESKAGFTPLHLSAQEGHCDMSNLLIEHQADVNHKAKNGLTPLHLCSQEDRVEVGGILLKNESDVDSTTKAGYTPLHVACHFGQMGMVRLLLANGASVKPTTAVNYTPLHQAAQQGHSVIVNELLSAGADPNATTNQGQTAMSIAQKLGYISVMETLKGVTDAPISPTSADEKYKVVSPETMQETFMSDSEDEGGEDTMLSEQPYHYLTVDEMKGLGDDSLPIDVTRDERDNRDMDDTISPQHMKETYTSFAAADNVDINRHPLHVGFLVSFLVDARGGAMRGVRHSGVRVIVPPRRASMPLRVTCRYLKRDKLPHPPPLMEGEALASRILELGPVGAKFLGPVMIEVPHFGSLRGKEREIVILRSDNGETWREHTFEASEEAVHDVLSSSFEKDELSQYEESPRMTRILTTEFPHYIAVVSRVRQEVHAIGPEGGMVSSTVVPQVQAVFPHGALTKKIKVGLQAQPIPAELTAKLLGNRVAVSPIVTVEPRRRKFHKPISLTIPVPQAANKGMINQYSGDAPTLRLLCSITGGTTRAQWEDVTGSTPLTFVNDCVSFTTTVSARFWLMDCRNISEATKMATELYREAIHVPFMAKFVVFAKRVDTTEARLRVFCMTDDKEDKTLEHQEHFTEVAKSRDVEVLEGKTQYLEFAGNLIPVTKSGEQLQLGFRAFKENRLPFTARVKDPHADAIGRTIFMREPKVAKGDVPQQPICILNIVLPEEIIPEPDLPEHEAHKHSYITHTSGLQRLSDVSNLLGEDWVRLAGELGVSTSEVNSIKTELCESSVAHQGLAMLRLWLQNAGNKASASALEQGLRNIGRDDIIQQTVFQTGTYALSEELSPSYTTKQVGFKRIPGEKREIIEERRIEERISKDEGRDVSIEDRTPQIGERIPKKEERRMTLDKDDGDEKKYVAEEKAVEEESLKSVSERKKEIEKRLSQDVEDKTIKEKVVTKETKITTKETKTSKETVVTKETTSTKESDKTEKSKKFLDDSSEKETAEEKAVSPEPAHLSFDEKRKSFEMGITPKEKIKQQDSLKTDATAAFIAEESKASGQEAKKEEAKTETKEEEEEKEMSFAEKRRSFEQGLSMKQPGDKLPAAERKKEAATDRKVEEEKRVSDFRRDSELFQEVSQGLDNIEKGIIKPAAQELLSPGVARTPPPSPADFTKDAPDNKKWSVGTTSNLLSGEDDKPRGADKSKEAVESSWLSRQDQVREEVKTSPIPEKHSPPKDEKLSDKGKRDDWKKEPIKKNEKPSLDKKDSIKKMSPDKTPEPPKKVSPGKMDTAKRISPDKTPEPSKKVSPVKIDSTKRISPDKTPEPSKKVPPVKMDSTKRISPDKTPEPPKKVSPVKNDKKPMDRGDSKKTPSPEKSVSIVKEKTVVTKVKSTEESTTATTEKNTIKTETSETNIDEKQVEIDSSKQKSTEKTKKESTKSETTVKEKVVEVKGKGKQKKEKNGESGGTKEVSKKPEEKETKQLEQTKGSSTEKKTSILGKTLETIKKPFQGKGKQKSFDSTKSLSQDIDESVDVREVSPKPNEKKPDTSKSVPQAEASKTFITAESSQCIEVPVAGTITVEESVTITSKASDVDGKNGRLQDDKSKEKSKGKKVPELPKISPLTRATSQEKEESKKPVKQQSVERVSVVEPLIEKAVQDMAVIAAGSMEKVIEDKTKKDVEGSPKEDKTKGKGKGKDKQGLAKTPSFEESDKTQKLSDKMTVVEPLIEQTTQDVAVVAMGGAEKVLEGKAKKDEKASPKDDKNKGKGKAGPKKTPSVEESDKTLKSSDTMTAVEPLIEHTTQDIAVIALGSVEKVMEGKAKKDEKGSKKDNKNNGKGKGKSGPEKTPSVEEVGKTQKTADRTTVVEPLIEKITQDVTVIAVGSVDKIDDKRKKDEKGNAKDDKNKGKGKSGPPKTPSVEEADKTQRTADGTTAVQPLIEKITQDIAVIAVGSVDEIGVKGKKDEKGSPKDDKNKGKGKSGPSKTPSVEKLEKSQKTADRTTVVEPLIEKTAQDVAVVAVGSLEKALDSKVMKQQEGSPKDDKKQGKGKGKSGLAKTSSVDDSKETPKQADRTTVIEPLIEKTKQDIAVIAVGSVDKKKGSPKDDKNKGKGKEKGETGPTKTHSVDESDKPQQTSTSKIGKMVEMIKEPFPDQTNAAQKSKKGKKQKSVELPKSSSLDKGDVDETKVELAQPKSATQIGEMAAKSSFEESDKELDKSTPKTEGKGKQKSVDPIKTPSPEKYVTSQIESKTKNVIDKPISTEPTKKEEKKKAKGKQKSIGSPKTPSLEKEDSLQQVSTSEPSLIEKTLETIKRPFQGKKDDKAEAEGKKGKGKSKQKSVDSRQSSTEQEPKEEIRMTTETVRLIKELSQDASGQVIEQQAISLVVEPFGDKPSLSKSDDTRPSTEGSAKTKALIKELSLEKTGQQIEEKAMGLVSKPFERNDEKLSLAETVTSSKSTVEREWSLEDGGKVIAEKEIDLVTKPLQEGLSTHFQHPAIAKVEPLITELAHEKSGFFIEERPIDLVSQPFQDILETTSIEEPPVPTKSKTQSESTTSISGPLIKELSHEKSGFIIEERAIDLVSQPFQNILETSLTHPNPPEDTRKQSKPEREIVTAPLIRELSHEKSGFIIEERPIDLVSQPFQEILESSLMSSPIPSVDSKIVSKTPREETTPDTRPLIKELAHEKSGFIIEERAIDLVSQPFQGIFEDQKSIELPPSGSKGTKSPTMSKERSPDKGRLIEGKASGKDTKSLEDIRKLPPSSLEGSTKAVSLMKELSQDKSGQVIEEGAIDLVAQPFLGNLGRKEGNKTKKKEGKSKGGDSKKGAESPVKKNDFEHIQKTIDEAKVQFDQFVGIVSDKAGKSTSGKTKETDSSSTVSVTTTTMGSSDVTRGNILQSDEQEIEIPVEKEEDFLKIQRSIQHDFQNLPSEITGTFDVKKITTTTKKPLEQEVGAFSSQIENVIGGIDRDMKKVTETMTKSVDGGITIVEKSVESHVKPVKEVSTKVIEKSAVTIQENISKIGETIPQKIGTVELTTITTTVTEPIKKGVESIPVQGEKVLGTVEKDLEKVKESVTKEVTVGERTIESQMKLVKDASSSFVKNTEKGPVNDAVEGLDRLAQTSMETVDKSKILTKGVVEDVGRTAEAIGQEAVGKVTNIFNSRGGVGRTDSESSPPELRAQSVKIAKFETVETIPQTVTEGDGTTRIRSKVTITGSSNNDEIGRIIKEMESQLLSTKFGTDEMVDDGSEVESDDFTKESRTTPSTPMPARKLFGDVESISDSEGVSMPYVTTPTLSRRVIGVGGSQRLSQDERPVVRVITEYVGDLSESEPEEDTYTVLEPEVKERRKFKIRFSPDMYGSEDKDDVEEMLRSDSEVASEALKKSDSIKSEKNIQRIERKFERMSSKTTEADPSMTELTEGEFQRIVSQLSLEEMDQALHQWDAGGLTPSEIDSKDLTLSSDDTTSPLQQERDEESQEGAYGFSESKTKGTKK